VIFHSETKKNCIENSFFKVNPVLDSSAELVEVHCFTCNGRLVSENKTVFGKTEVLIK